MIIGSHIISFDSVISTNYYANRELTERLLPDGTVVKARYQTAGKGLGENSWFSSYGKNLLMSVVLYPSYLKAEEQFMLNKFASLAVRDTVAKFLPSSNVRIKWPNDVIADDKKIAGILIKSSFMRSRFLHSIVGIGLNVNEDSFPGGIGDPVSMKMIVNRDFNVDEVFEVLLSHLNRWLGELVSDHKEVLDNHYLQSLYKYDEPAPYGIGGKTIDGRIKGIDNYGRLLISSGDGKKYCCDLKEVKYL